MNIILTKVSIGDELIIPDWHYYMKEAKGYWGTDVKVIVTKLVANGTRFHAMLPNGIDTAIDLKEDFCGFFLWKYGIVNNKLNQVVPNCYLKSK